MLIIKNLNKKFENKKILENFNLEAKEGEIIFISGESGKGKTTLFRILNGLLEKDSGEIKFKNIEITKKNSHDFFGLIFQDFSLFENLNVKENIELALKVVKKISTIEAEKISFNLLKKLKLSDQENSNIKNLSGGQKQRLAIARTLAMNQKIICFDEPTSALDQNLIFDLIDIIESLLNMKKIILLISHDKNFFDLCTLKFKSLKKINL